MNTHKFICCSWDNEVYCTYNKFRDINFKGLLFSSTTIEKPKHLWYIPDKMYIWCKIGRSVKMQYNLIPELTVESSGRDRLDALKTFK